MRWLKPVVILYIYISYHKKTFQALFEMFLIFWRNWSIFAIPRHIMKIPFTNDEFLAFHVHITISIYILSESLLKLHSFLQVCIYCCNNVLFYITYLTPGSPLFFICNKTSLNTLYTDETKVRVLSDLGLAIFWFIPL